MFPFTIVVLSIVLLVAIGRTDVKLPTTFVVLEMVLLIVTSYLTLIVNDTLVPA